MILTFRRERFRNRSYRVLPRRLSGNRELARSTARPGFARPSTEIVNFQWSSGRVARATVGPGNREACPRAALAKRRANGTGVT